jgi:Trk K+ transport system NAD-binding subunit
MNELILPRKRNFRRTLKAQLRDIRVLLGESRYSLLALVAIILGSALLLYFFYTDTQGQRIDFDRALYAAFTLLFFETSLDLPPQWYLQILYYLVPILGLVALVDGFVRFATALTNKQERGQKWQIAMASTYHQHVIICGIGRVGYRVALELLKFERDVVAIESNPAGRFIEKALAHGIPVIVANARLPESLIKAGIANADAIIPCTDDELANLDIALDARELNPEIKVVMRMFDPDLAQRVEKGFGIHTAYSVSALAAPTIAAASMRVSVRSSFYVGDKLLNISEVSVRPGSTIDGWTVQQIEEQLNLSVVSYIEAGQTHMHPPSELCLRPDSRILVLADLEALHALEKLNRA